MPNRDTFGRFYKKFRVWKCVGFDTPTGHSNFSQAYYYNRKNHTGFSANHIEFFHIKWYNEKNFLGEKL